MVLQCHANSSCKTGYNFTQKLYTEKFSKQLFSKQIYCLHIAAVLKHNSWVPEVK